MWSIPPSRDVQSRKLKTIKYSVRDSPFEVTEVISDVDYKLKLPPALRIHDIFHIDHLSPYKGNKVNGLEPLPPEPVTVDSEEEYEVDHIRDPKMFSHTLKYLVRWKGYGEGEDTWEPERNLKHAPAKLAEFHAQNPGAPRSINALLYVSLPWQSLFQNTQPTQTSSLKERGNVMDATS